MSIYEIIIISQYIWQLVTPTITTTLLLLLLGLKLTLEFKLEINFLYVYLNNKIKVARNHGIKVTFYAFSLIYIINLN